MDSRQAILPVALRVNANLFQTDLCRDQVAMDGIRNASTHWFLYLKRDRVCNLRTAFGDVIHFMVIIQFPLFNKEGLGEILLDKSPSIPLFQRGR
jgi:hypothetical protein